MPAKSSRLGLVARLYHSLGATSCQAERTCHYLSFLIGDSRTYMMATKVEQVGDVSALNKGSIPEVWALAAVVTCWQKNLVIETNNAVQQVHRAAANIIIETLS